MSASADAAPPTPSADAAPAAPDATPLPPQYPSGPYGTGRGDVIENICWMGFFDGPGDSDHDPFNETARMVCLEDFFIGKDPASRVLQITNSAGWCGPCQEEASEMPEVSAVWAPKGVRIMTAMLEDEGGSPSSVAFAKAWGRNFDLDTPVVADPDSLLDPYYDDNAIPFNLWIDTTTMKIIDSLHGYDPNYAEDIFQQYTE